jgi:protein ImuB
MPSPPALFAIGAAELTAVASWAGPWPVDERWWNPEAARHVVRCQVVDVRGRAYLVSGTMPAGTWQVEAIYD